MDGWRDPKSGKWLAKDWSGFVPARDTVNHVSICGPEVPGVDDGDRLFRWGDIPGIQRRGRYGLWVYDMWTRFGFPFGGGWAEQPKYIIDILTTVDAVFRSAQNARQS